MDTYLILVYILSYIGLLATSFYIINIFAYYRKKPNIKPATDKKVTILIPAFNEEKSIKKTIKSILSLDYPKENLEIIVIDDGSKDNTYKIAKNFVSSISPVIKVLTKPNSGKGSAINLGIKNASGKIIVTMDADSFIESDALKKMMGYFQNKHVMCVSPSMMIYKPRSILQRVQQIEYYMGIFLRKSFASMNAIHITPGAFSAYRKSFFDRHGLFDENNLTEDLEIALRIQSNHYIIENAEDALAYTLGPTKFKTLLFQRRRWYVGLIKNLWAYRKKVFGPKTGALGTVVLPVAVSTIVLSVVLTVYVTIKTLIRIKEELTDLRAINFRFENALELNLFSLERTFLTLFSNEIFLISILFLLLLWFYMMFAKRKSANKEGIKLSFMLFITIYSLLFTLWWIISAIFVIFNRKVKWRSDKNAKD